MPVITGQNLTDYAPFLISDLVLNNKSNYTSLNYSLSPESFGLPFGAKLVSGDIAQSSLNFSLSIVDPYSNKIVSNSKILSNVFSGIKVDLYTQNRTFIGNLIQNTNNTQIEIDSNVFADFIGGYTGFNNLNALRTFFIDFTTYDLNGNLDVYYFLANYPKVNITGFEIKNLNPIEITPLVDNFNFLKVIDVYAVPNPAVVPISGTYDFANSGIFNSIFDYESNRYQQTFSLSPPSYIDGDLNIALPFNLVAIPNDYLYTGAYFLSSGIKTSYYNTDNVPASINNITGYISCSQNIFDKNLDTQAIVKWDAIKTNNSLSFETYVYEDGSDNANYVFTSNNSNVESISQINYGTGDNLVRNKDQSTYYSGVEPIFKNYGSSGISWSDHTLFIDNYYSLPLDLYDTSKDLNYVTEIRIPSGASNNPELYFVYYYDYASDTFNIKPSGGQWSGSIYTGTYTGQRYGINTGVSGYSGSGPSVLTLETGILLAKRITGNADFILSEFEPRVKFPIKPNKNYEIKVRASYQDGSYSDFSETLTFNSGQIQNVVTGVFPNKYVVDGSGVANYISKFSDFDSITTGTLYYSGSNNLVFTELPATTTTENLYKLVIEDNIIKKTLTRPNFM